MSVRCWACSVFAHREKEGERAIDEEMGIQYATYAYEYCRRGILYDIQCIRYDGLDMFSYVLCGVR